MTQGSTKQDSQLHTWLFIIIVIEAVATRLYGLDRIGLWSDEIWAVSESSRRSLMEMFDYVRQHESHPPGHYLLLRVTQYLIGSSSVAVRLPSALVGVMTVILLYQLGRRYFSVEAGLIASALLAGSYPNIFYSQEARANVLITFCVLLSAHLLYQIVTGRDRAWKTYMGYWLLAVAACYLHYAGLVVVACQGVMALVIVQWCHREDFRTRTRAVLIAFLPVFILYLPWLSSMYYHLLYGPVEAWQTVPGPGTIWETLLFLASNDLARLWVYLVLVTGFLSYWAGLFLWFLYQRAAGNRLVTLDTENRDRLYFLLYLLSLVVLPILIFLVKSILSQPVYNSRHFLYASPIILLSIGYIASLPFAFMTPKIRSIVLVMLLGVIMAYQNYFNIHAGLYSKQGHKEDYRGAVQVLISDRHFMRDNNRAIVSSTAFFDYYLKRFIHPDAASDLIYTQADQIELVRSYLEERQIRQFYYLGAADLQITRIDLKLETRLAALSMYYQPVCRSKLHRVHVVKFMGPLRGTVNFKQLPPCPYGG